MTTDLERLALVAMAAAEQAIAALDGRWTRHGDDLANLALTRAALARLDWSDTLDLVRCDLDVLARHDALCARYTAAQQVLWRTHAEPVPVPHASLFGAVRPAALSPLNRFRTLVARPSRSMRSGDLHVRFQASG